MSSSLRGGVYWSLLSLIGGKALTFLATLILARLLAPSEFGVLAAVLAFILVLEVISDVGLKASVIYESERGITSRVQTAFTLNLIFTLLSDRARGGAGAPDRGFLWRLGRNGAVQARRRGPAARRDSETSTMRCCSGTSTFGAVWSLSSPAAWCAASPRSRWRSPASAPARW